MKNRKILVQITTLVILILGISSCNSIFSDKSDIDSSYQETKMSLKDKEKQNPVSFLSIDGNYRKNLIGEWVIEGVITNSATIATYKDVVLEIHFYSKTKSHLGSEREVIYEYFSPGKSKKFKIRTYGYKGTKTINLDIIGASAAD